MNIHTTPDHLEHLAAQHAAPIEFDTTNNVALLSLPPWTYVAPLAPVAVS